MAGWVQPFRVDVRVNPVEVFACPQSHHDLFQRCVARAFAEAVDGALDLASACFDRGQAVRHGQAKIVVTVRTDDCLVDVTDVVLQVRDAVEVLLRSRVANGVGNVDRRGTDFDDALNHFGQEIEFRSSRVFRRELDVIAIPLGSLHRLNRAVDNLLLIHLQLVLAMDAAGREEHVDSRVLRFLERLPCSVDVLVERPSQPADRRPVTEFSRDQLNRFEVARRRNRKTGLNDVHTKLHERSGNLELLRRVHAAAG